MNSTFGSGREKRAASAMAAVEAGQANVGDEQAPIGLHHLQPAWAAGRLQHLITELLQEPDDGAAADNALQEII